jgi:hypothetical protein
MKVILFRATIICGSSSPQYDMKSTVALNLIVTKWR